jgi:hypothetical protein
VRNEKGTEEMVVLEHPKEKVHSNTRWTTEGVELLVLLNDQSKDIATEKQLQFWLRVGLPKSYDSKLWS